MGKARRTSRRRSRPTGARVASWSEVQGLLTAVDVVVAATSSRLDILGVATLTAAAAARRAPLLVIDAGVPANADPKIGEIAGVTLVGLDQLAREQGRALAERERHIPVAEAILDAELMRWSDRRNLAVVEPAIKNLYIEAARIRAELLGSIGRGDVERATHLLLRRLLHGQVRRVRRRSPAFRRRARRHGRLVAVLTGRGQASGRARRRMGILAKQRDGEPRKS
ncbi:MAG: hypothetical protein R2762_08585 [Bryobacteraceae bacterium]